MKEKNIPAHTFQHYFQLKHLMSPQQHFVQLFGRENFRNWFADWAVHNAGDMDYLTRDEFTNSKNHYKGGCEWCGDPHYYVWEALDEGTDGWKRPPTNQTTRGYSYNVWRVNVTEASTFRIELDGDLAGSEMAPSFFLGRAVVMDGNVNNNIHHEMDMLSAQKGEMTVQIPDDYKELRFVVVAVPDLLRTHQTYGYQVNITKLEDEEVAPLIVVQASSVYNDDNVHYGPDNALSGPSTGNDGYWHSKEGDKNPWIEFKMSQSNAVSTIEVIDRLNCCPERFEDVEVRVGSSSSYESATSCGVQSYSSSTTYLYQCPQNTVGQHVFIKKLGTTSDVLHVNFVTVKVAKCCPKTEASLEVVQASSTFRSDITRWGPELALTEVSSTSEGYWHSEDGDKNPWIEFKMQGKKNVASIQVTDRLDCCQDRFEDVEVRVGSSSHAWDAVSCGIKSYTTSSTSPEYLFRCPEGTVGRHIFIKKHGTSHDVLHVNHVKVMVDDDNCDTI